MLVYSAKLNAQIGLLKKEARSILKNEMLAKVGRDRFTINSYSYPLTIVCFEDEKILGFFKQPYFQIGINRKLFEWGTKVDILNTLRHELAHYFCFIRNGEQSLGHGPDFRQLCIEFGWGEEVYSSTAKLPIGENLQKKDTISSKIKKLLELSKSDNPYEAENALTRAKSLMDQYQIDSWTFNDEQEQEVYVCKVLEESRTSSKMQAIYEILTQFQVNPVISKGDKKASLEVIGLKVHVETADYIAKFLSYEMERLWKIYRQNIDGVKGHRARNAFFNGLAKGFVGKLKQSDLREAEIKDKSLIALNQQMETVYPRMGKAYYSGTKGHKEASQLGIKAGLNLNIRNGINQKKGTKLLSLF